MKRLLLALLLVIRIGESAAAPAPVSIIFDTDMGGDCDDAGALYLTNASAILLLPAFLAYLTEYQIKPEERALLAKFGPEFAQYMARVRRWV